jgi:hypothetical protein
LLLFSARRSPAFGVFEASIPSTLPAFFANTTDVTAFPTGVAPKIATTSAVAERMIGRRDPSFCKTYDTQSRRGLSFKPTGAAVIVAA